MQVIRHVVFFFLNHKDLPFFGSVTINFHFVFIKKFELALVHERLQNACFVVAIRYFLKSLRLTALMRRSEDPRSETNRWEFSGWSRFPRYPTVTRRGFREKLIDATDGRDCQFKRATFQTSHRQNALWNSFVTQKRPLHAVSKRTLLSGERTYCVGDSRWA